MMDGWYRDKSWLFIAGACGVVYGMLYLM
jgi:hypothetical protein